MSYPYNETPGNTILRPTAFASKRSPYTERVDIAT